MHWPGTVCSHALGKVYGLQLAVLIFLWAIRNPRLDRIVGFGVLAVFAVAVNDETSSSSTSGYYWDICKLVPYVVVARTSSNFSPFLSSLSIY